jgi:flagellar basal body-associated protein FliL
MASKDETEKKETTQEAPKGGLIFWILLLAVTVAGSTGGFALCQLIDGEPAESAEKTEQAEKKKEAENVLMSQQQGQTAWIYDKLEPVLANLDEPGVTRYVRVTVILEISPDMDPVKGEEFLTSRQMVLRDWMTTYFAGLSLEDCRGTRNLSRIKKEVVDNFNKILFPGSRPFVQSVFFKEFAVQ